MKKNTKAKPNRSDRPHQNNYSPEYRAEILEYADANSVKSASEEYGVPPGTIQVWQYRVRKKQMKDHPKLPPKNRKAERSHPENIKSEDRSYASRGQRFPAKLRAEILEYADANSVAEAADEYHVSNSTIYAWQRRDRQAKHSASTEHRNMDPAPKPENDPRVQDTKTEVLSPKERDKLVAEVWRKNPGFGPSQIKNILKRSGLRLSVATVRNIMEENGYVRPKLKAREARGRYQASRPRELYHLDFYHFHVHKQKQVLLFILDDFSRFIAGWALAQNETADAVTESFEKVIAQHGKPERVMSDRGSAFHSWKGLSRFERMLEDYEIDFHLAKEPQTNGKVESLNAAFQKECLRQKEFLDLTDASRAISNWVERFNHQRTHHGLGGILVPADRFYGLVDRTTKLIELGQGADALSILNPDSRGLELFRVVSYGGDPQVFLMGKKIMG
jgi:putative transposase